MDTAAASPLVLVVEDHTDTLEMLELVLRLNGFAVATAQSAEAALELVDRQTPDAVSVDLGLPGMSGLELCRQLRRRPDMADAPIVAVTGWAAEKDAERAKMAGFDLTLPKPCPPDDLVCHLRQLIARRRGPGSAAAHLPAKCPEFAELRRPATTTSEEN